MSEIELDQENRLREVHFTIEELFFSRTDPRGRIVAGNSVFQRVSQYDWDELLGKPHNVIRHPNMPRGVFWLLWDQIRKGKPIGAYVKNKAKSGEYYWVFAVVTPIKGGYLSVRLKPSSHLLGIIEKEYEEILDKELSLALKPNESAHALLRRLEQMGYRDYTTFMGLALAREIAERQRAMKADPDPVLTLFERLVASSQSLLDTADLVFKGYHAHRFVPMNLMVQAGRLGAEGAAIGTISSNYSALSGEIRDGMDIFIQAAREVAAVISEGIFLVGTAKIQIDMIEVFREEAQIDGGIQRDLEAGLLESQHKAYHEQALENLHRILNLIDHFQHEAAAMQRLASGLAAIRVMGKVESGRLSLSVLDDLLNDLERFQKLIGEGLVEIKNVNRNMHDTYRELLENYLA